MFVHDGGGLPLQVGWVHAWMTSTPYLSGYSDVNRIILRVICHQIQYKYREIHCRDIVADTISSYRGSSYRNEIQDGSNITFTNDI